MTKREQEIFKLIPEELFKDIESRKKNPEFRTRGLCTIYRVSEFLLIGNKLHAKKTWLSDLEEYKMLMPLQKDFLDYYPLSGTNVFRGGFIKDTAGVTVLGYMWPRDIIGNQERLFALAMMLTMPEEIINHKCYLKPKKNVSNKHKKNLQISNKKRKNKK